MPAPLVSALTYLLAPRVVGAAADQAARARIDSLMSQGLSPEQIQADVYLNALSLLPRQSGVESTLDAARALYDINTMPVGPEVASPDARTVGELLAGQGFNAPNTQPGAYITRENPYTGSAEFLTPMEDFLRYGGRDEDDLARYLMSDEGRKLQSYGQTEQPATEVRFDQPPGGADGGLAALIRRQYA